MDKIKRYILYKKTDLMKRVYPFDEDSDALLFYLFIMACVLLHVLCNDHSRTLCIIFSTHFYPLVYTFCVFHGRFV